FEQERSRGAALETELAAQRAAAAEMAATHARYERELADARLAIEARTAGEIDERAAVTALERRCAELDERCSTALARAAEAETTRDALEAELGAERQRTAEALGAVEARVTALDTARADAERSWEEAEARADEVTAERDALVLLLEAAKKSIQGMNAAVDERLAAIDAKRARALQAAEARAEAAAGERDAVTRERDTLAEERN